MACQTFKQAMTSSLAMHWHLVGCTLQAWLPFRKRSNNKERTSFFFFSFQHQIEAAFKICFPLRENLQVEGIFIPRVKRHEVYVFLPAKGRYFHSRKGKLALRLPVLRCGQVEGFSVDAIHPVPLSNATETHQTLQDTHIRHTYTQVNAYWKGKWKNKRDIFWQNRQHTNCISQNCMHA